MDCSSLKLPFSCASISKESIRFEDNPESNKVLGLVDKIKLTIRLLKEGCHRRVSDQPRAEVDACADKDVNALRRQLRKIRRWQQNFVHFYDDDVQDLQLIIKAIVKHLGLVKIRVC